MREHYFVIFGKEAKDFSARLKLTFISGVLDDRLVGNSSSKVFLSAALYLKGKRIVRRNQKMT